MLLPLQPDIPTFRPTAAEIDLAAFTRNVRAVMRHTGTQVLGVVKADAYGHGAVACARALQEAGAAYTGVALAEEALALRAAGLTLPILLLGRAPAEALGHLVRHNVTCTLTCAADAVALQQAAEQAGRTARAHVKIDTGMSRLGVAPEEISGVWDLLTGCGQLDIEGMFTHFAAADAEDLAFTRVQTARFFAVAALLGDRGCRPRLLHCCASSGIHNAPEAYGDMVRPGLCLYGATAPHCNALTTEPVMHLRSAIVAIRPRAAGRAVSYGCTYICPSDRRIATLPIGYADGLPTALSNKGAVLIHGRLAPIVGRICMDMTMVDVTDIPAAEEGSPVTLFGNPRMLGEPCPTVNTTAALSDVIPYEILCGVSKRVPRNYM